VAGSYRDTNSRGILLQLSNTATERGEYNAVVKTARETHIMETTNLKLECQSSLFLLSSEFAGFAVQALCS